MDITEAFAPGGGNEELSKTDFFDFVVSPPPHCPPTGGMSDEEGFLHRPSCKSIGASFLHGSRREDHESRDLHSSFVKETNNNTLTALPPVSTITGSLTHHHHHHNQHNNHNHHNSHHHQQQNSTLHNHNNHRNHICSVLNSDVTMDQSECDYWGDDSKEATCSILLEDLNKYCWSPSISHSPSQPHGDSVVQSDTSARGCVTDRQNTDGAIYTLTVLNSDANSMDALDCCKSPAAPSSHSWSLRPNLDLDAILNLESAGDHDHDSVAESNSRGEIFHVIPAASGVSQYTTDDSGFVESKEICGRGQTAGSGDNNNDWKLSDQNHLPEGTAVDSAESLLRSALQGKLYSGTTTQVVTSSSPAPQASSSSLTIQTTNSNTATTRLQILPAEHQPDAPMHPCTEEDLILSHLDATTYQPGDYEKLKSIANEVVESYVNVSAATTVMYTLDPASGSLGTITLPADLSQVSTVTVVAATPQDTVVMDQGTASRTDTDATPIQMQVSTPAAPQQQRTVTTSSTKPTKKYIRRVNRNGNNNNNNNNNSSGSGSGSGGTGNPNGGQQGSGSPGSVQRKERSLHYCSICSKGFKDKYSVNVHIRTHTGEKPFACSLCGKSFRQKAHLAKHYQTHVAQKPNNVNSAAPVSATSTNGSTPAEVPATTATARNQSLASTDSTATCNSAS